MSDDEWQTAVERLSHALAGEMDALPIDAVVRQLLHRHKGAASIFYPTRIAHAISEEPQLVVRVLDILSSGPSPLLVPRYYLYVEQEDGELDLEELELQDVLRAMSGEDVNFGLDAAVDPWSHISVRYESVLSK